MTGIRPMIEKYLLIEVAEAYARMEERKSEIARGPDHVRYTACATYISLIGRASRDYQQSCLYALLINGLIIV